MSIDKHYQKYKWFYTKSKKLVVGGKSAAQNDALLGQLKQEKEERWVFHTAAPGSPFCAILAPADKVSAADKEECAIFTGCFSRAWKAGKRKAVVHSFKLSQLVKDPRMKVGSWGIKGKAGITKVDLLLTLTRQEGVLRAVPPRSVGKKEAILNLLPGRIDKRDMLAKIEIEAGEHMSQEELLSALPAGGIKIVRP